MSNSYRKDHDTDPGYPKPKKQGVRCGKHGDWVDGYVVCDCVTAGAQVNYVQEPSDENKRLGQILCVRMSDHPVEELKLICIHCAKERGLTKSIGVN